LETILEMSVKEINRLEVIQRLDKKQLWLDKLDNQAKKKSGRSWI
jgi:hypothetical protein